MSALPPEIGSEPWDPLHHSAPQAHHWTTTNVGEAMPGVQTPLSWTFWRPVGSGLRDVGAAVGALSAAEHADDDGLLQTFYGRTAFRVDPFALLGDRLPGTSGQEVVESLLGRVPEDMTWHPTTRRYPAIALRFPMTFARTPSRLRRQAQTMDHWYPRRLAEIPALDRAGATAVLIEAQELLREMVSLQTIASLSVVQPLHEAVGKLATRTGINDAGELANGGAEMVGLVGDAWEASRERLPVDTLVERHGFHGPLEGELSSRVWREDRAPLLRLLAEYAKRPDWDDPAQLRARRDLEGAQLAAELLAALPAWQRPGAKGLLALATKKIPLRGVAKRFLLQAFDVGRAAARRIGECLAAERALGSPDDVFFLTIDELRTGPPADAASLVELRRDRRELYLGLSLPADWVGLPEARPVTADAGERDEAAPIEGVGVSAGVIEGRARVVASPDFADVEPDEILVAPTTDPSWASIMFISSALVVDIGGALSHAAVVARELGIPCVVNTRTGTQQLRSGDIVRVDGGAGTVQVLERAGAEAREPVKTGSRREQDQ